MAPIPSRSPPLALARHIHAGNGNLVGDSVRASVLARIGRGERQADNAYNGMTLRELARASLVDRGIGVASLNAPQMVGLAFTHTSSDFGLILDAANKSVLAGWEEAEETFPLWTKPGILTDFKPARRVGLVSFPRCVRCVRAPSTSTSPLASAASRSSWLPTESCTASPVRRSSTTTCRCSRISRSLGKAAKATIGDLVYAVLTGNPAMSDGKALFHADHSNLLTGAASALSIDSLSKAKTQMATQKAQVEKGKGRPSTSVRASF